MNPDLEAWKETLKELGVMGLIGLRQDAKEQPRPTISQERLMTTKKPLKKSIEKQEYRAPSDEQGNPPQITVDRAASLEELQSAIQGCLKCILGNTRTKFVFGEGNPQAKLLIIGEGPGKEEDLQGRPFAGRSGELLDKMLQSIELKRSDVYIANIVKCRPPDNRTPTPEESKTCISYLKRQIEIIRPQAILTLGATPLREFLGVKEGITKVRGAWLEWQGIPVLPTFHPAYVLRNYTVEVRRTVWSDFVAAKSRLN